MNHSQSRNLRGKTVVDETMMYKADITYSYNVSQVQFTGNKINAAHGWSTSNPESAYELTREFPVGLTTEVYYNPNAPSDSVLKRGIPTFLYYIYWFGFGFAVIGGCLLFSFILSLLLSRIQ